MFTGYQTILPTDFTDKINSVGNSVGKIITSSFFFCFVLIILFPIVIPLVYTERILPSVKSVENFHQYFHLYYQFCGSAHYIIVFDKIVIIETHALFHSPCIIIKNKKKLRSLLKF